MNNETNIPDVKLLNDEEIDRIYKDGAIGQWVPEWILDDKGNKIGFEKVAIDAWCE